MKSGQPMLNLASVKAISDALADGETDEWVLINRLRAARGEPPLTVADFAEFDAFMSNPDAGPLRL